MTENHALRALLACIPVSGNTGDALTQKWEYRIWEKPHLPRTLDSKIPKLTETLNRYGSAGWELISVVWEPFKDGGDPPGTMLYHFRRRLAVVTTPDCDHAD